MRQRRIVLFALIVFAAFFLAYLALPINNLPWRTPAVAASDGHCIPAGATCIALNPEVTAATIDSTVCAPGASHTEPRKRLGILPYASP
jgi:hypothetical protein